MVLRGGIRQRQRCVNPEGLLLKNKNTQQCVAGLLRRLFCRGGISACQLVDGAFALHGIPVVEGEVQPAQRLLRLGKGKRLVKNRHRDVQRALEATIQHVPSVYSTKLQMWDVERGEPCLDVVHFLLPHEVLHFLVGSDVDAWLQLPHGHALQATLADWKERMGLEAATPVAAIGVWGDSAAYHTRDSLYVMLWNVLSGKHHKRYIFCSFGKRTLCQCGCQGRHTFDGVWRVMRWSLQALLSGHWPAVREDGVLFSESRAVGDALRARLASQCLNVRGACVQARGDWGWMKAALGLRGWKDKAGCCFKCAANKTVFPFTDFSLSAAWRETCVTHLSYMQRAAIDKEYVSALMSFPGFLHRYISVDLMHCADLGTTQYFLGNVLCELFSELGGNTNNQRNILGKIVMLLKVAASVLHVLCPVARLTMGCIRQDTTPLLRLKAAETRRCVPLVEYILEQLLPATTPHAVTRLECCRCLSNFYKALDPEKWVPGVSGPAAASHMRRHLLLYHELAREFLASPAARHGWTRWRIVPKHHLVLHCVEDQVAVCDNPRENWCYADESAIGDAKHLAESLSAMNLHRSIVQKFRVGGEIRP